MGSGGRRDEGTRRVMADYVARIVANPSIKKGYMELIPTACGIPTKQNDRPEGRSWVNMVAGAGGWLYPRPPLDPKTPPSGIAVPFTWSPDGVFDAPHV
jgi:hypothetical protein